MGKMPAQGIKRSIWPNFSTVAATIFSMSGTLPASPLIAIQRSEAPVFAIRASAAAASLLKLMATLAPSFARRRLVAAPMPFEPPVIRAVLPARDIAKNVVFA